MVSEEEQVLSEISKISGIDEKEIIKKVSEKEDEFSGLVSRLGAIYLVGKELGYDVTKPMDLSIKVSDIFDGMNSLSFSASVMKIFPVREISTERFKGKVQTVSLGDNTGIVQMNLWNDDTDKLEGIGVGDTIDIRNVYSKRDRMGILTVGLGRRGSLEKSEKSIIVEDCSSISSDKPLKSSSMKNNFLQVSEHDIVNTRAVIIKVYKTITYKMCPQCRKKVSGTSCSSHTDAELEKRVLISCVVDDGFNVVNTIFFGKEAEFVLGCDASQMESQLSKLGADRFVSSIDSVGKEFLIKGIMKKNSFTDTLELLVREVNDVNIEDEIKSLL